jgi:hypothetical protein
MAGAPEGKGGDGPDPSGGAMSLAGAPTALGGFGEMPGAGEGPVPQGGLGPQGGSGEQAGESSGGGDATAGAGGDATVSAIQGLSRLDLGVIPYGATKTFSVPDRVLGFTVIAQDPGFGAGIAALQNPSSELVIANYAVNGHATQRFVGPHIAIAANPQSDLAAAWPIQAGTWELTFGQDQGGNMTAEVWLRRTQDGQFHGGIIDFDVFIVPNTVTPQYVSDMLTKVFSTTFAGLGLGVVTQRGGLAASASVVNDMDEARALLADATSTTQPAVSLLIVSDLSNSEFGSATVAVGAGVPGSGVGPAGQNGIIMTTSDDTDYDATVLRHELGHLAGLFHTSELDVADTDPLSDTPECAQSTVGNNPASCPDASNVMFPVGYGNTALTADQMRVVQGSTLYRGVLSAGGEPEAPLPN